MGEEEARLDSLRKRVEFELRTKDFEIVASAEILWSGWECDTDAVIVRLADGTVKWVVVGDVDVSAKTVVETLRERKVAYEKAIADTEALLEVAKREGLA